MLAAVSEQELPIFDMVGREALEGAMRLTHLQSTDRIDVDHARIMLAEPGKACGYSRDGWVDLKESAHR